MGAAILRLGQRALPYANSNLSLPAELVTQPLGERSSWYRTIADHPLVVEHRQGISASASSQWSNRRCTAAAPPSEPTSGTGPERRPGPGAMNHRAPPFPCKIGVFSPTEPVQAHQRTSVRGPTFIRLLSRLTDVDIERSGASLPDRLSQWLDWTHALALSTALDGRPEPVAGDVPEVGAGEDAECARVRASLAQSVTGARELVATGMPADKMPDYAPFRQRYITLQRSMQSHTGHLRGRVRDILAGTSVAMGRLAEVDAVLEAALSPREQSLMGTVPALLGRHFDRLRGAGAHDATGAWLDGFRRDMQGVLLAELDVRFQPVEALLAALRTR